VEAAAARGRKVLLADVDERLPFDDGAFGGVVLKDLLEHVRDPVAVVREVQRVVAPGGRVFASSPDAQRWVWDDYTHRRPFTRKAYKLLFADNGFAVREAAYESVMPGTSIVSQRMPDHRRPAPLRLAAWLPVVRRNVYVVAERPR
jgi:SAM-dependent methyltransferase